MFWKCWGYEPPSRDIGILGKIQYYHYRRQVPNAKTLFDFILEFSLFVWRWSAVYLFVQSPTMFHVDLSTGLAFTWIGQMFMIARRLYYYFTLPTLKCTFPMINGRVFVGDAKKPTQTGNIPRFPPLFLFLIITLYRFLHRGKMEEQLLPLINLAVALLM